MIHQASFALTPQHTPAKTADLTASASAGLGYWSRMTIRTRKRVSNPGLPFSLLPDDASDVNDV